MKNIVFFAVPLALSSMLQQLFNSADIAVVGRFAGPQSLAAVGSNGPVINLIINMFVGLSTGANVVLAMYIGRKEEKKIEECVHTVILLALISGAIVLTLGLLVTRPILELMNTPEDVIDKASLYLKIYFLGMPFVMLYNFGAAVLRSKGDTERPLFALLLAGVVNVFLNLLLVIVFKLDVAGVAIATVISNIISSSLIIFFLLRENEPFRLNLKRLRIVREPFVRVLKIGLPSGMQSMVFSISNIVIQSSVNTLGALASAGGAAASNFDTYVYFLINAFAQATVTFTGQNYGARRLERCKTVYKEAMTLALASSILLSSLIVLFRGTLIKLFTTDPAVIYYANLRIVRVLSLIFLECTYEVSGSALRGMARSLYPAIVTLCGTCVLRLIWVATVFKSFQTYEALMTVYPVSWAVTGLIMIISYFSVRKKLFKQVERPLPL